MIQTDAPSETTRRRGRSVRWHLSVFTLALSAPILIFVGVLLWQLGLSQRAQLEGDASETARSIAFAIDREVTGLFATADVLTLSNFLQTGDLEGFHRQASEISARQNITPVLYEPGGQQLVNVRVPWGSPLPRSTSSLAEVIATRRAVITDLFIGAVSKMPIFAVLAPVLKDGEVAYVLNISLSLDRLQTILNESELTEGWVVSIVDRQGVIMARNQRAAEFVGKPATQDLQDNTKDRQGTWNGTTADGAAVFGAYARSRLSGFRAAVGVRYSDLNRPLWTSLTLFAALGITLLALSSILAVFFGQRITGPIRALADRAALLGRGDAVGPLETGLEDVNQVSAELATASNDLRESTTDLVEANEELQRFAYIVSHDLRAPLVNIMGFTAELESLRHDMFARLDSLRAARGAAEDPADAALGADFDEALGFIKASITRMDRLINAILRLSREGRRDFEPERIDMNGLVQGIAASLAHQTDAAGASLNASELPALRSDRLAVEQIFTNLIDNALKYSRKDVPGYIEVIGRASPRSVIYEVRDNGRGIDPKDRERVFELFRRSGAQDKPGEGIGLAHVRALVRRLGGTISLASEPGRGSTFTITLPRSISGTMKRKAA